MACPHGGLRSFHQTSTCLTQLTLGPYVVQMRSRDTPRGGDDETLVVHRVVAGIRRLMGYNSGGSNKTDCPPLRAGGTAEVDDVARLVEDRGGVDWRVRRPTRERGEPPPGARRRGARVEFIVI